MHAAERITAVAMLVLGLAVACSDLGAQTPTQLAAVQRSGQTFLTWREPAAGQDEFYRIYRHTEAISEGNLGSAQVLGTIPDSSAMYWTERWLADYGYTPTQQNFIIEDLGPELDDDQGLFVYTTHSGEEGTAYYAVTTVTNGSENTTIVAGDNSLTTGVDETVDDPSPIMVWQSASGLAMVFTQFMDFSDWNPTFTGYAYNYFVSLPTGYDPAVPTPLFLQIQGWGSRYVDAYMENSNGTAWDWPAIQIWGDDPHQSWYYGFTGSHSYGDEWPQYVWGDLGSTPTSGEIRNFTEERLLRSIYDVIRDPRFNVDTERISVFGHSMGGSGSLALAMRYPNVFAVAFCSEPMTNYGGDNPAVGGDWIYDVEQKWGSVADNLPIDNQGHYASHLAQFDGRGVWDWMDHQQNMLDRPADEMAFIVTYHGTQDDVIEWDTQGDAWYQLMNGQARRGWHGAALVIDHTWYGFLDTPNFVWGEFSFRRDRSFPGLTGFSLNLVQQDNLSYYNMGLEWSCPWNDFAGDILDTPDLYEVVLRLYDPDLPGLPTIPDIGTVDVTPRRLQQFVVTAGEDYDWENRQLPGNALVQSGTVQADAYGLLTIPHFTVTKDGNRLRISSTGFAAEDGTGLPGSPALLRCGPNPFSTEVRIHFVVPEAACADLVVYNLDGRLVSTLAPDVRSPGAHAVLWDGRDGEGRALPDGLYLCGLALSGGGGAATRLVLAR
jgi:pimeloyl-ACP methyl ester carboxylesterase